MPEAWFPDERIGPYRVVREIGRGGMGVVYLARREDESGPGLVAIKVIRRGMDSDEILARFRRERRLLAAMKHPNIAMLLDGGALEDGRPYLVMEYVEGRRIDEHCETHRLSVQERLRLFALVCQAVHHAHRNLVVHRDLKPGNIIVTAEGVPKLLDFGIARIVNPDLADFGVDPTRTELRLMTPEYASPEQVRGEPVSAASDVYALGVLLYELLTGHRPYRLRTRLHAEMERVICQVTPAKPSDAVTKEMAAPLEEAALSEAPTADSAEFAARAEKESGSGSHATGTRRTAALSVPESRRLRRALQGDLDNIVMMALRKEPQRRYPSADAMAEDIFRHLRNLPVRARQDTMPYRFAKFVRRNRAGVAAAAVVALSLAAGGVASTIGLVRAQRAEAAARTEARIAQAAEGFLVETLESADPSIGGPEARVADALRAGSPRIDQQFADDPAVRAAVHLVYGRVHRALGRHADAERHFTSARDAAREAGDRAAQSEALLGLGAALFDLGRDDESEQALAAAVTIGGAEAAAAQAAQRRAAAMSLHNTGDLAEAEREYRAALAMERAADPQGVGVAEVMDLLGRMLIDAGRVAEAAPFVTEALERKRRLFKRDHAGTAFTLLTLGYLRHAEGDLQAAAEAYRESCRMRVRMNPGDANPNVMLAKMELAGLLEDAGDSLRTSDDTALLADYSPDRLGGLRWVEAVSLRNRACIRWRSGRIEPANALFQRSIEAAERAGGDGGAVQAAHTRRVWGDLRAAAE